MMTTEEICKKLNENGCELPPQTLRDWVTRSLIVPKEKGGKGRGKSHKFSERQSVGIAYIGTLFLGPTGCRSEYIRDKVIEIEKDTYANLKAWCDQVSDPYRQERLERMAAEYEELLRGHAKSLLKAATAAAKMFYDTIDQQHDQQPAETKRPKRVLAKRKARQKQRV
jgi:hypothetical protein